jgi:energy-coupling factor transporter ATP-binding protein EcfA2
MGIDEAKDRLVAYRGLWNTDKIQIDTEEDTRFQMIDVILTEVLGWERHEIKANPHSEGGFADYLVRHGDKSWMVLEAKRSGNALLNTQNLKMSAYKVAGPAMQLAADGTAQARRYCHDHSVEFAALTNGNQWLGFLAVRTDGRPYGDGKAISFPSLEAILSDFAVFYDLFSKEGVLQRRYHIHINKAEGVTVHVAEKLIQAVAASHILKIQRSQLSMDLDHVFREFFTELSGDRDPEMIAKCFVESKESREADSSLEKIATRLVSSIEAFNSATGAQLLRHIEVAVETQRGEFVLIVGEKGAGKSTFIDRFFRLVLSRADREKCLVVKVDMADSPGDKGTVSQWITQKLIEEIERSLFKDGLPEFNDLRGIFNREYERWKRAEFKHLYESNAIEFNIKFGEYVSSLIKTDPYGYTIALLRSCVIARKLMPCLVFDNTDHFPQDFQESVFQFAQSVHRAVFSFVICPITDRTIWQLSKQGPLQSYVTHVFYLPAPSPKEVLEKRIIFVRGKIPEATREASYF